MLLALLSIGLISGCTAAEPYVSTVTEQDPNGEAHLNETTMEAVVNENDHEHEETVIERMSFFPGYESLDEMVEDSDLIIRSHILDERVEWVNVNITLEDAITARRLEYESGLLSREELDLIIETYDDHLEDFEPRYDYVVFYRVEILEIFQGNYEGGDVIEIMHFIEWHERYEVESELILFLRSGRLGYFAFEPHQAIYEVLEEVTDVEEGVILEPLIDWEAELHTDLLETVEGAVEVVIDNGTVEVITDDGTVIEFIDDRIGSFDISLEILREIAEENGLLD